MKRMICILIASSILSTVAYAGQWQQDETGWRYQNDDGSYKTGWFQDVDGQWYYFNDDSAYMLSSTTTPDGYLVSDTGVWHEGNDSDMEETYGYENKIGLDITMYSYPGGARALGYTLPVYIYHNTKYYSDYSDNIKVSRIALSDDGLPYIAFTGDTAELCFLNIKYRYYFNDGTYVDNEDSVSVFIKNDEEEVVKDLRLMPREIRKSPVSVDIWIDAGSSD